MADRESHTDLAHELRHRLMQTGVVDAGVRAGAMRAGRGEEAAIAAPIETLARTVGEVSYRVTDAQVAAVRQATGSDKAAFEVVMSASVGAALLRWDAAVRAIREATDATG